MKYLFWHVAAVLLLINTFMAHAQKHELPLNQLTIGVQQTTLKDFVSKDIKTNYSGYASFGNTYLFNGSPSDICFGFDAVYFDASYGNYKLKCPGHTDYFHQAELGVQLGISMLCVMDESFYGKLYVHYAPRLSAINALDKWYYSFGDYFVGGVSMNFNHIGVGCEMCHGICKYKYKEEAALPKSTNITLRVNLSYNF